MIDKKYPYAETYFLALLWRGYFLAKKYVKNTSLFVRYAESYKRLMIISKFYPKLRKPS
jgi:hypothetical protein